MRYLSRPITVFSQKEVKQRKRVTFPVAMDDLKLVSVVRNWPYAPRDTSTGLLPRRAVQGDGF